MVSTFQNSSHKMKLVGSTGLNSSKYLGIGCLEKKSKNEKEIQ